ncbi:PH domain-containing protein [Legionella dresdenensis]|uniref:PH domain-containing protein n=1 Tax=Legionella dresdenensis TaxID=450200 RepID=A0ABV8CG65_9GAMM
MTAENDVYVARLHWILFTWPILMALGGLLLGIILEPLKVLALFLIIFSLIWWGMIWVNYHFSSLTIRKKQVILRMGLLVRQTVDIPLTKIETIDIRQSILGSILRYGALTITGTGGTKHTISYIDKPLTCRRYIEQLMHEQ